MEKVRRSERKGNLKRVPKLHLVAGGAGEEEGADGTRLQGTDCQVEKDPRWLRRKLNMHCFSDQLVAMKSSRT